MRRSTVIYLLIFVALIGVYYLLKNRQQTAESSTPTETTAPITYLFSSSEGIPTDIHIESKNGEVVEVARNKDNAWALTQPTQAAADQSSAEAAASQVTTMRILNQVSGVDPSAVGLDNPEYTLTLRFSSGGERKVEVGVLTPTELGYYVRDADGNIVIVSKSSVDALLGLLTNPPYAATETPLPVTPGATVPTQATPTP